MIWNYGLHWRADRVWWGWQNNPGFLYGATNRNLPKNAEAEGEAVDFRKQTGIYALYADYELVYVDRAGTGQAKLFNRLKHHRKDHLSERWNRFSWFGTLDLDEDGELYIPDTIREYIEMKNSKIHDFMGQAMNILEAVSIAISEPRLNLQRGRWKWKKWKIPQYYQWWVDAWFEQDDE